MSPATATPRRFTFDLDLGRSSEPNHSPAPIIHPGVLDEVREAAFREGVMAGERNAAAGTERQLAGAASQLADQAAVLVATLDANRRTDLADAVGLAASVGRKLAGALIARLPAVELELLLSECLATIEHAPHLVIRCHPDLAETLRESVTGRMHESGFSGRLVVIGDPEVALGDGKIEWADGGLVRDSAALAAEIDERIASFLAAHGIEGGASGARETNV